jgi:hypothetical protein
LAIFNDLFGGHMKKYIRLALLLTFLVSAFGVGFATHAQDTYGVAVLLPDSA